jgi:hypothetical protein
MVQRSAMKKLLPAILSILWLCGPAQAGNIEVTKESSTRKFDPAKEVQAFYQDLLEKNPEVKQQVATRLKSIKDYDPDDAHCGMGDPQTLEWMPARDTWDVESGFQSSGHFLVIQPVEFARAKWRERLGTLVAEFSFTCDGKTKMDDDTPDGEQPSLIGNKISIQFLGFRSLQLSR